MSALYADLGAVGQRVSVSTLHIFGFFPERNFLPNGLPVLGPTEKRALICKKTQRNGSNINTFSPSFFDAFISASCSPLSS